MKASMKIMAAGVVAVMLMAGIAGTLAYTATVTNTGNSADVQATDIGFFKSTTECKNGEILQSIHLSSARTQPDTVGGQGTITWLFTTGDKEFVQSGVVIKKVSDADDISEGSITLTITDVKKGNDMGDAGNHFVAKLGTQTADSVTFKAETGKTDIYDIEITFSVDGTLAGAINNAGAALSIEAKGEAANFVGFTIGASTDHSTVTAVFTSS